MIFFLLILLAIIFKSIRFYPQNQFNRQYLSLEHTNVIKGIFVILVIFLHSSQYLSLSGMYDEPYMIFKHFMGQMIVSVFLFYSGYGVMTSLSKKGFSYVKTIPTRRLIKVLINFDIAVLLYLLLDFALGQSFDLKTILLSLIAWENIGNSNWYILAILGLYLITFIAFFPIKWFDSKIALYIYALLLTILSVVFVFFEMKMGKESYFFNTIILYPLGIWYCLLKPSLDSLILRNDFVYSLFAALLTIALYISYTQSTIKGIEGYSLWAICFTLAVIAVTMKMEFQSPLLQWFGEHIFSVYILQRIPMMVLHHFGVSYSHKYFFIILSIVITVVIAQVFDTLTGKMWKKIMR